MALQGGGACAIAAAEDWLLCRPCRRCCCCCCFDNLSRVHTNGSGPTIQFRFWRVRRKSRTTPTPTSCTSSGSSRRAPSTRSRCAQEAGSCPGYAQHPSIRSLLLPGMAFGGHWLVHLRWYSHLHWSGLHVMPLHQQRLCPHLHPGGTKALPRRSAADTCRKPCRRATV